MIRSSGTLGVGYNVRDGADELTNRLTVCITNYEANFSMLEPFLSPDPPSRDGTDFMFRRLLQCLNVGGLPDHYRIGPMPTGCILNEAEADRNKPWLIVDFDFLRVVGMIKVHVDVEAALETCQDDIVTDGFDISIRGCPLSKRYKSLISTKLVQFIRAVDTNLAAYGFAIIGVQNRDNEHFGNPYSIDPEEYIVQYHTDTVTKERRHRLLQPVLFKVFDTSQFRAISIKELRQGAYNDLILHPERFSERVGFIVEKNHITRWEQWPSDTGCVLSRMSRLIVPWCKAEFSGISYRTATKSNSNRAMVGMTYSGRGAGGGRAATGEDALTQRMIESALSPSTGYIDPGSAGVDPARYSNREIANRIALERSRRAACTMASPMSISPALINEIRNNPRRMSEIMGRTEESLQLLADAAEANDYLLRQNLESMRHPALGRDFVCLQRDQSITELPLDREPAFYQQDMAEWKDQVGRALGIPDFISKGQVASNRATQSELIRGYRRRLVSRAEALEVIMRIAALQTWGTQGIERLQLLCDEPKRMVAPTAPLLTQRPDRQARLSHTGKRGEPRQETKVALPAGRRPHPEAVHASRRKRRKRSARAGDPGVPVWRNETDTPQNNAVPQAPSWSVPGLLRASGSRTPGAPDTTWAQPTGDYTTSWNNPEIVIAPVCNTPNTGISGDPGNAGVTWIAPAADAPTWSAPAADAPTWSAPAADAPTWSAAADAPTWIAAADAPTWSAPAADAPTWSAPAADAPTWTAAAGAPAWIVPAADAGVPGADISTRPETRNCTDPSWNNPGIAVYTPDNGIPGDAATTDAPTWSATPTDTSAWGSVSTDVPAWGQPGAAVHASGTWAPPESTPAPLSAMPTTGAWEAPPAEPQYQSTDASWQWRTWPVHSWTQTVQVTGTSVDPRTHVPVDSVHTYQQTVNTRPDTWYPAQDVRASDEPKLSYLDRVIKKAEDEPEEIEDPEDPDYVDEGDEDDEDDEGDEGDEGDEEEAKAPVANPPKKKIRLPVLFNVGGPHKILPTAVQQALQPYIHPGNLVLSQRQALRLRGPIYPVPSSVYTGAGADARPVPNADDIEISLRFITNVRGDDEQELQRQQPPPTESQEVEEPEEGEEPSEDEEQPKGKQSHARALSGFMTGLKRMLDSVAAGDGGRRKKKKKNPKTGTPNATNAKQQS